VRRLFHEDRTVEEGIPITAVPRTLLDLAEVVSRDRLDRRSKRRTGSNSWTCMRSRS